MCIDCWAPYSVPYLKVHPVCENIGLVFLNLGQDGLQSLMDQWILNYTSQL